MGSILVLGFYEIFIGNTDSGYEQTFCSYFHISYKISICLVR